MGKVRSAADKQELFNLCSLDHMMLYDHAVVLVDVN